VALVDNSIDEPWPNNYGVWVHEWDALEKQLGFGLDECLDYRWKYTDAFLGGEGSGGVDLNDKTRIVKDYARVNRKALKARAMQRCEAAGVRFIKSTVGKSTPNPLQHAPTYSTVTCDDGTQLTATFVVDASGSQSTLTRRSGPDNPGVQIAYGIMADVDSHPLDEEAMLFMDYRTDWLPESGSVTTQGEFGPARAVSRATVEREPTFLYAMPMGDAPEGRRRIFFEETSLVARPPMDFDECKARLELRLKHMGVKVHAVEEEEFCYIPMGTALPSAKQRVLAIGGAAGTVHAATGYMMCRMTASSIAVAGAVARNLAKARADGDCFDADAAAEDVYSALWTQENRLQRDFCVFGGEYLMQQPVTGLRGFFGGFFALPEEQWTGFLAGWPGLPGNDAHDVWHKRLLFGINLWLLVPWDVKLRLVLGAVSFGGVGFFRCVLPVFQETTLDEAEQPMGDKQHI